MVNTNQAQEQAKAFAEVRYKELKEYFSTGWKNIDTEKKLVEKLETSTKLDYATVSDMGGGHIVCDFNYKEVSGTISIQEGIGLKLADVIDVWLPDLSEPFSFEMKEDGTAVLVDY